MRSTVLTVLLALASGPFLSASSLTGISFFTASAQGNSTLEAWNTVGGDVFYNLYLYNGVTPLNSGNGSGTAINLPLTAGTYSFIFRAQPGFQNPGQFGMNLFFDGATNTPGISALVGAGTSTFAANGAPFTPRMDGLPIVAGANSLLYVNGNSRVTLTALSEQREGGNRVSAYSNSPSATRGDDYVGGFTLSVATPEPTTFALLGSALVFAGLLRRRSA